MVSNGNRDLVHVNGNWEGARVVSTNFNQPQGIPNKGNHQVKSSKKTISKLGDQQDDECIECYYEADLRKDLEVHDTTMVTMQKEILSSWVVAKVLNVRIVILNQMLKAI